MFDNGDLGRLGNRLSDGMALLRRWDPAVLRAALAGRQHDQPT